MDKFLYVMAITAGSLSVIASFGVIYALHRVEILIETAIDKVEPKKVKAQVKDTLMDLVNALEEN